ncbi:MAG: hypothetical protein ACTSRU_06810 [Candidatus Hodarchaeales archaeon]
MKNVSLTHIVALIIIVVITLLLPFCSLGSTDSSTDAFHVEHVIESIWNNTGVNRLSLSGKYLFLQSSENEIILLDNEQVKSSFKYTSYQINIRDFIALERVMIISNGTETYPTLVSVSFDNYSSPEVLNVTGVSPFGPPSIASYYQHVYTANQECGFKVYNYTDASHPQETGSIPSSNNWHARQVFIVSDTGFFSGDFSTGIYQLSNDYTHPLMLKLMEYGTLGGSTKFSNVSLDLGGVPAVSGDYIVINHIEHLGDYRMFHILPRKGSSLDTVYNVSYSVEKEYTDCFLVNDSVLVVASKGNSVTLFTITPDKEFDFLVEIDLQTAGKIDHRRQINDTNEFYIANEAGGLLKLALNITNEPVATAFHVDLLMISLTIPFVKRRR